jgi:subtilisin family serine protease
MRGHNLGKEGITMKTNRIPYILLIFSALILLGFIFKCILFPAKAKRTSLLHSDSVQTAKLEREIKPVGDSVKITHSGSRKARSSSRSTYINTGHLLKSKETEKTIYTEKDILAAELKNKDKSYHKSSYNKKHILVKFLPEVEDDIEQGEGFQAPGRLNRLFPNGKVWKVEIEEGQSVEELLEQYQTEQAHMIQYAQLDYMCDAQEFKQNPNLTRKAKWYLDTLNIQRAWHQTQGDESIIIALLDTGTAYEDHEVPEAEYPKVQSDIYLKAPNLANTLFWANSIEQADNMIDDDENGYVDDVYGYDFVNNDGHPNDDNGHGTYLGSLMVQNTNKYNPSNSDILTVIDGFSFNSIQKDTLEKLGKINKIMSSNDDRWEIEDGGYWTSFEFSKLTIPEGAIITSAVIYCEHHEENDFSDGHVKWEIGTGWPLSPKVWASRKSLLHEDAHNESLDSWDVTPYVSISNISQMQFRIKNNLNKKCLIDHIYMEVTWQLPMDNGIAPNCTLMNLKVLDYNGKGYSSAISEAIYYAADHEANVINLSIAWPPGIDPGPIVHEAISYAVDKGVIIVAGTGNNAKGTICYPAAYDEVIAVGATQYDGTRAYYSNYGPEVEIMAPGGNNQIDQNLDGYPDGILQQTFDPRYQYSIINETLADPMQFTYTFVQGTSLATAQVTGIVALMLSVDPDLSLSNIRNILKKTAIDLGPQGWDTEYGFGLINAGTALKITATGDYMNTYDESNYVNYQATVVFDNTNILNIIDGFDLKSMATLKELNKTYVVHNCDLSKWEIDKKGSWTSFEFSKPVLPEGAIITKVIIYCGHYEEDLFTSGKLFWELGTGWPESPEVWAITRPPINQGFTQEKTDSWDVTNYVNTFNISQMEFRIKNEDKFKKIFVNHICVEITCAINSALSNQAVSIEDHSLIDLDGDGYYANETNAMDCDDYDPAVYPGAPEIANDGIDQDCNGIDLIIVKDTPCTHPDCLYDPEIDMECDGCLNDEEIGEDCI